MKSGGRYWLMIAVLVGATTGMAYLSHGESWAHPAAASARPRWRSHSAGQAALRVSRSGRGIHYWRQLAT